MTKEKKQSKKTKKKSVLKKSVKAPSIKVVKKKLSTKNNESNVSIEEATTKPSIEEEKSQGGALLSSNSSIELKDDLEFEEEIILTDAEGRRYCGVSDCDQIAMVENFCRYHYLFFWKQIQVRRKILSGDKLQKYIEELTASFPNKYIDALRKDLSTRKGFMSVIQELEVDEKKSEKYEDEARNWMEEVRGFAVESSSSADDDF